MADIENDYNDYNDYQHFFILLNHDFLIFFFLNVGFCFYKISFFGGDFSCFAYREKAMRNNKQDVRIKMLR